MFSNPAAQRRLHSPPRLHTGKWPVSAVAAALPLHPAANGYSFIEPDHWTDDGGLRRKAVLDTDHRRPRVVRLIGVQLSASAPGIS